MFSNEGGEVEAGAFSIAKELRRAVRFDDLVLTAREDCNVEADDIERTFLHDLMNKNNFIRSQEAIADDFDFAAGLATFDAGLVEDISTNNVNAKFFFDIEKFLNNPAIVKSATFEVEENILRTLRDARFGEVAARDEFMLTWKPGRRV